MERITHKLSIVSQHVSSIDTFVKIWISSIDLIDKSINFRDLDETVEFFFFPRLFFDLLVFLSRRIKITSYALLCIAVKLWTWFYAILGL